MVTFELFDWYCPFDLIYNHMIESMYESNKVHKVLVLGVGRSNVIELLYKKGFRNIVAIDISNTIIMKMQQKYSAYSGVEFITMDCRNLIKFADDEFSLVIDKACIDALFCKTDFIESTQEALQEIFRVLQNEGTFISISHASSLSRVPYLRRLKWAIDTYRVPSDIGEHLTLYILNKTTNETVLNKKIDGGDSIVQSKSSKVVSNLDQSMNKSSTVKSGNNTGSLTVTASVDILANLVAESANDH